MKTVFLICGQLQSGKDTFGQLLAKAGGGITIAIADPIKEVAISMLGMPSAVAYGGEKERRSWTRYGKDAREWLQWIGTELGRAQIAQEVWLDRLVERIEPRCMKAFVVTDARLGFELEKIGPKLGERYRTVKIRIRRPGAENKLEHQTESEQQEIPDSVFDEVVVNKGTLQDLEQQALDIAKKYLAS